MKRIAIILFLMILPTMASHAAIVKVPASPGNSVQAYDPTDPNSSGPFKVIDPSTISAPAPSTTQNAPLATSSVTTQATTGGSSYIWQLMRWGAPPHNTRVPMAEDPTNNNAYSAYYRDAFTGMDLVAYGNADGDQWTVNAIMPSTDGASTTTTVGSLPLYFYSTVGSASDCFYSPGWIAYICGSPMIYVQFNMETQCDPAGAWTFQLLYNNIVVDERSFTMNLRVPKADLPLPYLNQRLRDYGITDAWYGNICDDLETGKEVECDPYNIPLNEPWAPIHFSAKGCALTSAAMVANFHGSAIDEAGLETLDKYLLYHNGFKENGNVRWRHIAPYCQTIGSAEQWIDFSWTPKKERDMICKYGPQVMAISHQSSSTAMKDRQAEHFVVAYGKDTNSMSGKWRIVDPSGGRRTLDEYSIPFVSGRLFKGTAATAYPFPIYGFNLSVYSPVELLVTAPDGRHKTGYDPTTDTVYSSIPDANYGKIGLYNDDTGQPATDPEKLFSITGPTTGTYTVQAIGTGTGTYDLEITTVNSSGQSVGTTELLDVPTSAGQVDQYNVDYEGSATAPLSLDAGYAGVGQSTAVNGFLTFNSPAAARIKVSTNVTQYRIAIHYGATIEPGTFSATLNRKDVSGMFHPSPGTTESVYVPLQAGRNTLLLKCSGTTSSGHTGTDRDRFSISQG